VRDVGAIHERLVPGLVADTELEEGARVVTFANGLVARERIVDLDDRARRVAYAVVDGPFTHHHASMQVAAEPSGGSTLTWITDLLPDDLAPMVSELVDAGAAAMMATLGG
jgi:hypothetical protein